MSIIPQLFLHDMLRALAHEHTNLEMEHYSPLLHCSLLAFATALSEEPLIKHQSTRDKFAERAKQLLQDELGRPSLNFVQALAMLSEYHSGLGEKEQGYMYMGALILSLPFFQEKKASAYRSRHLF
jgi:hypothetical protein